MKIALCFSGQPRDIDINYPVYKQVILDNNDVDIFVHTWFDPENLSRNCAIPDRVHQTIESDSIAKIKEWYKPKRMVIEKPKTWTRQYEFTDKVFQEGPTWAKDVKGGIEEGKKYICNITNSMFYSIMMANLTKEQYSIETETEYDLVLRCRFDFVPHMIIDFNSLVLGDAEVVCHSTGLPYGMPLDWFSFGATEPMNVLCGIYNHIKPLVKQSIAEEGWWCNELLVKHHLTNNNIKINHANMNVIGHKTK